MRLPLPILLTLSALPASARAGMQSAFDPKGIDAAQILEMTWIMFIGGGVIFLFVMALVLAALFGPPAMRASLGKHGWIIGGGIVFPAVVLVPLLIYTLMATNRMVQSDGTAAARIEIIGELWWWRVRYLDAEDNIILETANEIHIPVGQPVDLLLKSSNVIHSFWVPNIGGKIDMLPGHVNRQRIEATQAGVSRGQCAEYCGAQHAKMAFYVVAHTPQEYQAWLASERQAAVEPRDQMLLNGKRLFLENRCGLCHTVRGTEANGALGPDLTHVGGRQSLGAGILPNGQGSIAGWISASQQIKPGNKMPTFNQFSGTELRALSAYLASLQ